MPHPQELAVPAEDGARCGLDLVAALGLALDDGAVDLPGGGDAVVDGHGLTDVQIW